MADSQPQRVTLRPLQAHVHSSTLKPAQQDVNIGTEATTSAGSSPRSAAYASSRGDSISEEFRPEGFVGRQFETSRPRQHDTIPNLSRFNANALLKSLCEKEEDVYCILSIDGGGVRGILASHMLSLIEDRVNKEVNRWLSDHPQFASVFPERIQTAHMFDCIAGTSIGGIMAAGLAAPHPEKPNQSKYDAQSLTELMTRTATRVFHWSWGRKFRTLGGMFGPKYDASGIDELIDECLKEHLLSDSLTSVIITSFDINERAPFFFEHFKPWLGKESRLPATSASCTLKLAAQATSRAPAYFKPVVHEDKILVDGAILTNNPVEWAFFKCLKGFQLERSTTLIVSVGTGRVKLGNFSTQKSAAWGIVRWAIPAFAMMWDAVSCTVEQQMNLVSEDGSHEHFNYLRLQPELTEKSTQKMDNVRSSNIERLKQIAQEYFEGLEEGDAANEASNITEKLIKPLALKVILKFTKAQREAGARLLSGCCAAGPGLGGC
eukprot:GILJ01002102.1.p1 GENE.GILJ01002102.1~~GILJ01002102.1.p1  ORF type:complete len:509 (-),score=53.41 GILJ01002102.1:1731-3206(-)